MTGQAFLKLMILLVLLAVGGIAAFVRRNEDQIDTYMVRRVQPTSRMLGAIIPRGQQAWFFKLTGPREAVADQSDEFRRLIESINFTQKPDGAPSWTLPEGWTEQPGENMRFATLEVSTGGHTIQCTVTALPVMGADLNSYLLANINRWRDQMRVAKMTSAELNNETTRITLADSQTVATLVDITGDMAAGGGMGMGGMAGDLAGSVGAPMDRTTDSSTREQAEQLKYEVPPGWKPGELTVSRGGITVRRAAVFEVVDGQQGVEITVTKLSIGSVLANVNRWRGQIGMNELTADQLDDAKQQIEFLGQSADYVQFTGAEQSILGVIAERGTDTWFIKLQGSADLAARERQHFEQFVKSIRLLGETE